LFGRGPRRGKPRLYGRSFRFAKYQVTPKANHDCAGQCALTPAEARRTANTLAERSREQGHDDIGGSVKRHRECSQQNKLEEDVSVPAVHELGDERKKKQGRLRI